MEKNPSWTFQASAQCTSLQVFPYLTKASNQVENVLEARGLGLQLFFKGLLEKNGGQRGPPPALFPMWPCFETY